MSHYVALTVASLRMYFRNRQAIFWAMFFPLLIMIIFGLLNFDNFNSPDVGIDDQADNAASARLIELLRTAGGDETILDLTFDTQPELLKQMDDGDLDTIFVIPDRFADDSRVSTIEITTDVRRLQEAGVAAAVLNESLEELFGEIADVPEEFDVRNRFALNVATIEGQDQGFQGFLIPGIAAMAIMQGGIFGVVFSLVRFKAQGVLRRLYATPIDPSHFLVGQVTTRLIIAVLQAYVLLIVGALAMDVSIGGSVNAWIALTLLSILGGALFISLGLAISGIAKTEDVAAPVSNVIALPMMFLSGVFFPVDALPDAVSNVTQFLPLTYLADGMREAALDGSGITSLGPELLGLAIWTAIAFAIATRTFRWE